MIAASPPVVQPRTPLSPKTNRRLRHDKHWRYVSQHTVAFWAQSYVTDLVRLWRGGREDVGVTLG